MFKLNNNQIMMTFDTELGLSIFGFDNNLVLRYNHLIHLNIFKISLQILDLERNLYSNKNQPFEVIINSNSELYINHNTVTNLDLPFITNLIVTGWLPRCNLSTDAEIIQLSRHNMQYGLNLDAPNLKELTVNIETSKIMILSDQTPKDFKLITEGKEGYFYDPYYEYDPCS